MSQPARKLHSSRPMLGKIYTTSFYCHLILHNTHSCRVCERKSFNSKTVAVWTRKAFLKLWSTLFLCKRYFCVCSLKTQYAKVYKFLFNIECVTTKCLDICAKISFETLITILDLGSYKKYIFYTSGQTGAKSWRSKLVQTYLSFFCALFLWKLIIYSNFWIMFLWNFLNLIR